MHRLFASTALALACVAPAQFVTPPPDWYSGDTHEHIQLCNRITLPVSFILLNMRNENLDVGCISIWGRGVTTQNQFQSFMSDVTGQEHPATVGQPQVIQFGVETSEFSASEFGHIIGLNIDNAQTQFWGRWTTPGCRTRDGTGDWEVPLLDLFRTAPQSVNGYAHVVWPVPMFDPVDGFSWFDTEINANIGSDARCIPHEKLAFPEIENYLRPTFAPIGVATRRVDFLESPALEVEAGDPIETRWFGMYYKLLNAGLRVSASTGSDADCIPLPRPRTWVLLEPGAPLTFENWTQGLKAGRVTLSNGATQFLGLEVDGQPPGSELRLSTPQNPNPPNGGPATVRVRASFQSAVPLAQETIEIVQNGEVVATRSYPATTIPGRNTLDISVPVTRSGWIAARTKSLTNHTGAVYLQLDGKPAADCIHAEYWMLYCDYVNFQLDELDRVGGLPDITGCSAPDMRDYLARGRRIFKALRDYDLPTPDHVARYGTSAPPSCGPAIGITIDATPVAGIPSRLSCFNAPSNASGVLVLGRAAQTPSIALAGASLLVDLSPGQFVMLPTPSDEGGYAEVELPFDTAYAGRRLHTQFMWVNPTGCDADGLLSSSDALVLDVQ